jgi:integrase
MRVSETKVPGIYVRLRSSGRKRYCFTVTYGGRAIRRISTINTLKGAMAERAKLAERLLAGLPADKPKTSPYTVARAVDDYLQACESLRCRRRYRDHARALRDHFSVLNVGDLSQIAIAGFRKTRTDAGTSPATINRDLSFLRASLNHAAGEGRIETDHYFARLSKADRRKVFAEERKTAGLRRVTNEEFEAVVSNLAESYRPVVRLLLATGMRKSEATGLLWKEVRGDALYLTRTKSGKPRWVPLTAETARLLPARAEGATDESLVFRGQDGGAIGNNVNRAWDAARKAARLDWLRIHDLRHEAASRYLEAGGTLRELQELGGWSSLELVQRYAKASRDRIRETLSRMAVPGADLAPAERDYTRNTPADGSGMLRLAK